MNNKVLLIVILLFMTIISGCDRDLAIENNLEDQLEDSKVREEVLQKKIDSLRIKNKSLSEELAEFSSNVSGGLLISEQRKAMTERDANLKKREKELLIRESRIKILEDSLRKQNKELSISSRKFVENKQDKLEAIGEAKQMKSTYNALEEKNKMLEARVNDWFIWFSIIGLILFFTIIWLIIQYMKIGVKDKQIFSTLDMLEQIELSKKDKILISNLLGNNQ